MTTDERVKKILAALDTCDLGDDIQVAIEVAAQGARSSLSSSADVSKSTTDVLAKQLPVFKTSEERYVLGIVLEPLKELGKTDSQKDLYSAQEVRQACYKFMEEFGNLGLQHQQYINGRVKIIENWITREDQIIDGQSVAKGTWLLGIRVVDDELWQDVKVGKITGFSIGGYATRTPVDAPAA